MMEYLILNPDETIILQPGEMIGAGDQPLQIRFERVNEGTNHFAKAERLIWSTMKHAHGNQIAIYRQGDESRLLFVVPEAPKPDGFAFEDHQMYKTIRLFRCGKADLFGLIPKAGDTFIHNNITYTVCKTPGGPCYQDIGNYNVMVRIAVDIYRP
jgi:hypothetical protein